MRTSVRISSVVVLAATVINTVYGSPTWNNLKGTPPTFVKPLVLPASFSRSTLSNDLLDILKQSRANAVPPSSRPDDPSLNDISARPAATSCSSPASSSSPAVLHSVLDNLLASYDHKSTGQRDDPSPSPPPPPPPPSPSSCDRVASQIDRPPSPSDCCHNAVAAPSRGPGESVPGRSDLPCFAGDSPPPAAGQPQAASPPTAPSGTAATTTAPCAAANNPFPGSDLLPIEPLKLPPKFSQELVKLLSDSVETATAPSPSPDPCAAVPPNPAPLGPPDQQQPSAVSASAQPSPATPGQPSSRARQLLNMLMSSPSAVQKLKALLGYSVPSSSPTTTTPTDCSTSWPANQSSTPPNSCVNMDFIKYLSTIPRCLNRQ